jgi:hypothetical protein
VAKHLNWKTLFSLLLALALVLCALPMKVLAAGAPGRTAPAAPLTQQTSGGCPPLQGQSFRACPGPEAPLPLPTPSRQI